MRIKSYFADSVQEAIEKARQELGTDAMLMNSKKTDFELRALGSVEVVFGLPGQTAATKPRLQMKSTGSGLLDTTTLAPAAAAANLPLPGGELAQQMADLRRQVETVKRSLHRQGRGTPCETDGQSSTVQNVVSRLVAADLSEDLSQEIAEAVELQTFAWKQGTARGMRDFEMVPSEMLELALGSEFERRLQVSPELGVAGSPQKRVLFVGPAGAGKTTSLIKLALRCGLQARMPVHIFSLDTLRVGGWETLATYSRIAGVGFDPVHSLSALEQLLSQHVDKRLILVDTPGFGPADMDDLNDLGGWVSQSAAQFGVQLVLPATLRTSLLSRTIEKFAPLKASKLLLTRADEVESKGVLVDIAMRSGMPLSYISTGQTIPEDIEEATKADLLASLSIKRPARAKQEAA